MGKSKTARGLGFRDLVIFNQALLAKQGWRIIQNPNTLTTRILRAKYYQNSSFMEAPIGARASFVWHSICSARSLLSHGLLWRVGDGKSIKIWGDRWLPTPITHSVQSPPKIIGPESMVNVLIDQNRGCWKQELLVEIFTSEEARVIENIPLSPCLSKDIQFWKASRNGIFTVRSAYHLGKELIDSSSAQSSRGGVEKGFWKDLWALCVSNQVKMFTWRACHNILPTRSNLSKRKVVEDNMCPCCKRERETAMHVIWSCPASQDVGVGRGGDSCFHKCSNDSVSFEDLLENIMQQFRRDEVELFVVIARCIWLRRNSLVFEGKLKHPNDVLVGAMESLKEFWRCKSSDSNQVADQETPPITRNFKWQPPPDGTIKVNWDASINGKEPCIGMGMVARDCRAMSWQRNVCGKTSQLTRRQQKLWLLFGLFYFAKSLVFLM
jgi:hypothetical protein